MSLEENTADSKCLLCEANSVKKLDISEQIPIQYQRRVPDEGMNSGVAP